MSLLIVSGPPGSGKSSVATLLADAEDRSVLVAGDDLFAFLRAGRLEPWLPESNHQNTVVIEAAAAATGRFAADYATVYDGVLGPWFIDEFAAHLGLVGFDYVVLLPAEDVCVERVQAREGHGFTSPDATRKMHHEFSRATIAARHVVRPGRHETPDDVAAEIKAHRRAGLLRYSPS
ncbi:MAG: AAA family ATPase [Actinomycetota bacterium]